MKVAIYGLGILATLLLFAASVIYQSHKITSTWVIFSAFVIYALAFTLYWQDDIKTIDLKEPTFSEEIESFSFSLGEHGITVSYTKDELKKEHINRAFNFGGYRPVELYIENNQLYADVKIYGGRGFPPIQIKKNKLSNKPDDWNFNSNEKAIEIVTDEKIPIYQFFYKSPSHIVMNGIFPYPGGFIIANENGAIQMKDLSNKLVVFKLKPIFKYPSWKYPGEYAK